MQLSVIKLSSNISSLNLFQINIFLFDHNDSKHRRKCKILKKQNQSKEKNVNDKQFENILEHEIAV